jgi:hypothetical protein
VCVLDCETFEEKTLCKLGKTSYFPVLSVSQSAMMVHSSDLRMFCSWIIEDTEVKELRIDGPCDRRFAYVVDNGKKYISCGIGCIKVFDMQNDANVGEIQHTDWVGNNLLIRKGFVNDNLLMVRVEHVQGNVQHAQPKGYVIDVEKMQVSHIWHDFGDSAWYVIRGSNILNRTGSIWNVSTLKERRILYDIKTIHYCSASRTIIYEYNHKSYFGFVGKKEDDLETHLFVVDAEVDVMLFQDGHLVFKEKRNGKEVLKLVKFK